MERRLLRGIINPSMILVFLTGLTLAYLTGYWQAPWLQAKFALVLVLGGLHGYFARCVRAFAADANERSAQFYRVLNEVPAGAHDSDRCSGRGEAVLEHSGDSRGLRAANGR